VGQALRAAGMRGEIVGTDVSHGSLGVAERTGAYTSVAPADLRERLPAPDDRFDAVVCVGVMTYVPDVEAVWREFARVVRPGGVVVFTQRDDVWEERDCAAVVDRLTTAGVWVPLEVTEPRPYLPGNTGGLAPVGVRYVTARVEG
jgi:ubiquinone/menaquinone biosynthesis C-methylase UbiE